MERTLSAQDSDICEGESWISKRNSSETEVNLGQCVSVCVCVCDRSLSMIGVHDQTQLGVVLTERLFMIFFYLNVFFLLHMF